MLVNKKLDTIDWETKFSSKPEDFYKQIVTTIATNGHQLFFAENKEIVFKTWDASVHRELSKLLGSSKVKEDFEEGKLFKKILYVLQFMCVKFAGRDLWIPESNGSYREAIKLNERKAWIASHHETDVLLAYVLLHIITRGDIMSVNIENNNVEIPITFDLTTMEFLGSTNLEDALFIYNLKTPINIRGHKVTKMILGPTTFNSVCEIPLSADLEKTNFDVISHLAASVYYLPEITNDRVVLQSQELNRLMYNDIKGIREASAKHYIGLNTFIEVEDETLNKKFKTYLPWYDPSFLV